MSTRSGYAQADREAPDPTNPAHYKSHPSGLECISLTESMGFCLGNAVKYLWRFRDKNGAEDLKKALWYARRADSLPYPNEPARNPSLDKWRRWYGLNGSERPESLAINYLLVGLPLSAAQVIEEMIAVVAK